MYVIIDDVYDVVAWFERKTLSPLDKATGNSYLGLLLFGRRLQVRQKHTPA